MRPKIRIFSYPVVIAIVSFIFLLFTPYAKASQNSWLDLYYSGPSIFDYVEPIPLLPGDGLFSSNPILPPNFEPEIIELRNSSLDEFNTYFDNIITNYLNKNELLGGSNLENFINSPLGNYSDNSISSGISFIYREKIFVIYDPPEDLGSHFLDEINSFPKEDYNYTYSPKPPTPDYNYIPEPPAPDYEYNSPPTESYNTGTPDWSSGKVPSDNSIDNKENGITVAVIDSGVNSGAISGVKVESYNMANDGPVRVSSQVDELGHGTKVTKILVENAGAENINKLMSYKVFDENGTATGWDVFRAAADAIERGADVVNMSIGLDADQLDKLSAKEKDLVISSFVTLLEDLDQFAGEYNAKVIMAAGNNSGEFNIAEYLPDADNIIFVGDNYYYSDKGEVTVAGNGRGTSFAAPEVAGGLVAGKSYEIVNVGSGITGRVSLGGASSVSLGSASTTSAQQRSVISGSSFGGHSSSATTTGSGTSLSGSYSGGFSGGFSFSSGW